MKKYICYGSNVKSKTDGQIHYVSSRKVAMLYGVNPKECIMVDYSTPSYWEKQYQKEFLDNLRVLQPRKDGNYVL